MTGDSKRKRRMRDPIQIWEALLHEIAEQAAEDSAESDETLRCVRAVEAMVKSPLGRLRGQRTPVVVPVRRGVEIAPEVQSLARGAVMAQLELLRQGGLVRYAHQDLTGLSDHDLRTLLTVALEPKQR